MATSADGWTGLSRLILTLFLPSDSDSRSSRRAISICLGLLLTLGALGAEDVLAQPQSSANFSETEHIFICCVYNPERRGKAVLPDLLRRVGASLNDGLWWYTNAAQRKVYVIHLADSADAMTQALYTENAHIIINGHSNYGMGSVFATPTEQARQNIPAIRFVDDDRIFRYSSPWVAVNVPKLLERQRYPNWWATFKDGTSAIMPYDFDDPRGAPAYNYVLAYQPPGAHTRYRIESTTNGALERFPDCLRPAWYAADGSAPDPKNPDHRRYFITNTNMAFQPNGRWLVDACPDGCCGTNYLYSTAGAGSNQVRWNFSIPSPGTYAVFARWPASGQNVSNAQYAVTHARGTTTVIENQQTDGARWNQLGAFDFDAGQYSVVLNDQTGATNGRVVADAVRVAGPTNAPAFEQVIDNTTCPRPHFGKKTIVACGPPVIDPAKLRYKRMFYDGCSSGTYYLDVFHRGVMFYTIADGYLSGSETYLRSYLQGKSDEQIWAAVQELEPVYDYFDFSRRPNEQCAAESGSWFTALAPGPADNPSPSRSGQLSFHRVFETLRLLGYIHNEQLSHTVVLQAFGHRRAEAVEQALAQLSLPLIERTEEGRQSHIRALIVARRILEAFPEQAVPALQDLYARSNAITRGNIIRACWKIPGEPVRNLLLAALSDPAPCEEADWISGGSPMRLCDLAYNQLVLRYQVRGVLRTLAPAYSTPVREYHLGVLKAKLQETKG